MLEIIEIIDSPLKNKKYRAIINDGKHYDFGLKGSKTFLDHQNHYLQTNYQKRHLGNDKERYLIENGIISPALLSYYILWGGYTDINNGIKYLNNIFKKHSKNV